MLRTSILACLCLLLGASPTHGQVDTKKVEAIPSIADKVAQMTPYPGYFHFYWDDREGKIWLQISRWEEEFLYVNGLTGGLGSNDIGLDRNQLGNQRVVAFRRIGPKVLLQQPNYAYRAISDNPDEARSVAEAFAASTLWGFKVEAASGDTVLVDLTPFLLQDAHGVVERLKNLKQGTYKLEPSRSAVHLPRTKNFPLNSEFEATLTFLGESPGPLVRTVTPTPEALTLRQHLSFVQLPDDGYQPRTFDPRAGYLAISYADYATPIGEPLVKRWIARHRLQKKDPAAARSEPVKPIVYYLDRGAPEPIRTALMEGAAWWNAAFESAGYINAFQVRLLPEDADPMDVRYNLINWVHRSTRGWSYGSSVTDPRTGEIIKGHVLLGSLRVRQDFLLAQGLLAAYADGQTPDPRMEALALARLRQLSAHEVGHTLGLVHNFAASTIGRASVMDYPHPYILMAGDTVLDFSQAYTEGIGPWDVQAIRYGYEQPLPGVAEKAMLQGILAETIRLGLRFISDTDARAPGGAHPYAHLWDNGVIAHYELSRIKGLRQLALANFGEANIPEGTPLATLEQVLAPVYFMHRYQVEATAKLIGGVDYNYAVRGDGQMPMGMVGDETQRAALDSLMMTLRPDFLKLPVPLLNLLPPQPLGYTRDRELFKTNTGLFFDPLAAAEASADHTLSLLLHPQRLARLVEQYALVPSRLDLPELFRRLTLALNPRQYTRVGGYDAAVARVVERRYVLHLLRLASDPTVMPEVAACALGALDEWNFRATGSSYPEHRNHVSYLRQQITWFKEGRREFKLPPAAQMPDGAPIGCGEHPHGEEVGGWH